jgi:mannose-6-phosphate isomerase-like protein (cupin superfamily)
MCSLILPQESSVTFINLSLDNPVSRLEETRTGTLISGLGARFVMEGGAADGRVSLVEHPIPPRGLAAPMHLHTREDEYSFILEGEWGFQLGDTIVYAKPGDLVYKPRNVWHTFWNATDEPGRLLEVISPSGFEHFFAKMADLVDAQPPDMMEQVAQLAVDYGLQLDFDSVPGLVAAHGLAMPEPPVAVAAG